MWNLVSWNPTPKEGGLLAKVVPKHEHSLCVDPLSSIPMGKHSSRTRDIVGTLFMIDAL